MQTWAKLFLAALILMVLLIVICVNTITFKSSDHSVKNTASKIERISETGSDGDISAYNHANIKGYEVIQCMKSHTDLNYSIKLKSASGVVNYKYKAGEEFMTKVSNYKTDAWINPQADFTSSYLYDSNDNIIGLQFSQLSEYVAYEIVMPDLFKALEGFLTYSNNLNNLQANLSEMSELFSNKGLHNMYANDLASIYLQYGIVIERNLYQQQSLRQHKNAATCADYASFFFSDPDQHMDFPRDEIKPVNLDAILSPDFDPAELGEWYGSTSTMKLTEIYGSLGPVGVTTLVQPQQLVAYPLDTSTVGVNHTVNTISKNGDTSVELIALSPTDKSNFDFWLRDQAIDELKKNVDITMGDLSVYMAEVNRAASYVNAYNETKNVRYLSGSGMALDHLEEARDCLKIVYDDLEYFEEWWDVLKADKNIKLPTELVDLIDDVSFYKTNVNANNASLQPMFNSVEIFYKDYKRLSDFIGRADYIVTVDKNNLLNAGNYLRVAIDCSAKLVDCNDMMGKTTTDGDPVDYLDTLIEQVEYIIENS